MLFVFLERQMIDAARADARSGFRTVDDPVRMLIEDRPVLHRLVIEPLYVHLVGEFVANGILPFIERRGGSAARILLVKESAEAPGLLPSLRVLLLGNLV